MRSSSRWWRTLGAGLFALVLGVLTFGPGLDAIICRGDAGMSAAAAGPGASISPPADANHADAKRTHTDRADTDRSDPDEDRVACVHGHCHHGVSYAPVEIRSAERMDQPRARHEFPRSRVPVSDPKFTLKRPPRA